MSAVATWESGMASEEQPSLPRLAVRKAEAAEMLSMSVDTLERHVLPTMRVVRCGRMALVPVSELARWLDERMATAVGG